MGNDFLEVILGSGARARLIKFFILNPVSKVSPQELKERLQIDQRRIRGELDTLLKIGIIKKRKALSRFLYYLDKENQYYPELKKIVAKCTLFPQLKSIDKISNTGHVKLVLVTGVFANTIKTRADILIVGDAINKVRLRDVIREVEAEIGRELRYSTFTSEEYEYRLNMFDKFIREFFDGPHKIILNRMGDKGLPMLIKKQSESIVRK
jgi:predicted transcriptional regulator